MFVPIMLLRKFYHILAAKELSARNNKCWAWFILKESSARGASQELSEVDNL